MPRKKTPRRAAITVKVVAAFFDSGGWKEGTPLEIASVPLIATEPAENARRTSHKVSGPVAEIMGGGVAGWRVPVKDLNNPMPIMANIPKMKRYVGNENIVPDSRIPRRFTNVSIPMKTRLIRTVKPGETGKALPIASNCGLNPETDNAEVIAIDPATIETATVRI